MAKRAGKKHETKREMADDEQLYDIVHAGVPHISRTMQSLQACADRILTLAEEVAGLDHPNSSARNRLEHLALDLTLVAALTLQRMSKGIPGGWLKDNECIGLGSHQDGLIAVLRRVDGQERDRLALFPEVIRPLERSRGEWLKFFDQGDFESLASDLRGLASSVRATDPLAIMKCVPGGEDIRKKVLQLAALDKEAVERVRRARGKLEGGPRQPGTWEWSGLPGSLARLARALRKRGGESVETHLLVQELDREPSRIMSDHRAGQWTKWIESHIGRDRKGLWWWKGDSPPDGDPS